MKGRMGREMAIWMILRVFADVAGDDDGDSIG